MNDDGRAIQPSGRLSKTVYLNVRKAQSSLKGDRNKAIRRDLTSLDKKTAEWRPGWRYRGAVLDEKLGLKYRTMFCWTTHLQKNT
jgi:hypothetical protein